MSTRLSADPELRGLDARSLTEELQPWQVEDDTLLLADGSYVIGFACEPLATDGVSDDDLVVMRQLDEQYLVTPFYGARRMAAVLRRDGLVANRKRIRRLMRVMGIEAIYQKPNTSRRHPAHKVYPYLLRDMAIERPNQVWCADITYVPMAHGFVYLVAVMDWASRRVLAWRISIGMETDFCVEALQEALDRYGTPEVFNTDQGVQFTSAAFLEELEARGVRISMDGKGRFLDNIFIERLCRSLKYE